MPKVLMWNKTFVFPLCVREGYFELAVVKRQVGQTPAGSRAKFRWDPTLFLANPCAAPCGSTGFSKISNQSVRKTRTTLQLRHSLCRQACCFLWMRSLTGWFPPLQGFNPMWEETLVFTVHMPEIALIRFLVWDHDPIGRDFIGQRTIAFSSMMPGERKGTSQISGLGFCLWKIEINVFAAEISS